MTLEAHTGDILFSGPLEIDGEELESLRQERGGTVTDLSDDLRLLARQNHLRLLKRGATRESIPGEKWRATTNLQFQSLVHAECRFIHASLTLRFDLTRGAQILKIEPTKALAHEVKFVFKRKPSLGAEVPKVVKVTLDEERTQEQTVSFPALTGSNFEDWANWTFRAPTVEYELQLDEPLQIVSEFPKHPDVGLLASLEISARVAFRDWKHVVPLVGSRGSQRNDLIQLDR